MRRLRPVIAARLVAVGALAAPGCGEPAIEVTLVAPADESMTTIDYGCIDHVEIQAQGTAEIPSRACVAIEPGTVTNLRDHHLAGRLDIPIPIGFNTLAVRGLRSDDACNGDTVFNGWGVYQGGDRLAVSLSRGLDCRDATTAPDTIKVLALTKAVRNAPDRCAALPDVAGAMVSLRHAYAHTIDDVTRGGEDPGTPGAPVAADGVATIAGAHFTGAVEPSCLAASVLVPLSSTADYADTATCFQRRTGPGRTLCQASSDEVLMPTFDQVDAFNAIVARGAPVAVGFVWDATTGTALAGARFERLTPNVGFGDGFFTMTAAGTVALAPGASATTAAGLFALELGGPTTVLVSADGYASQRVVMDFGVPQGYLATGVQSIGLHR